VQWSQLSWRTMGIGTEQALHDTLVTLVTIAVAITVLYVLVEGLRRTRPGFAIGKATAAAFAVRVTSLVFVSLTSVAQTLRGGDESIFLNQANEIANSSIGSGQWGRSLVEELHVFVFAVQRYLFESPELALRVMQVTIAIAGLVLLAAAVYELAGSRASVIAMWILAFEPAGIFFSSLLHKEANMLLAIGLVALGGAKMWERGEPRHLVPILVGCLIAVATRPYAGWFLIAASAAIVLHAGLRMKHQGGIRSLSLVSIVILLAAVTAPTVLEASSDESLRENLQVSQDVNATDNSNLKLESVDFSTRTAVVRNLPRRTLDVVARPFPWQLGNVSQALGLLGTSVAYVLLVLLVVYASRNRGQIMARAGPLIYPTVFLLVAYSLSAGNAGTAFRYRTQIVALAVCVAVVLWRGAAQRRAADEPQPTVVTARLEPSRT
jgi:hypothetical protein